MRLGANAGGQFVSSVLRDSTLEAIIYVECDEARCELHALLDDASGYCRVAQVNSGRLE